LLKIVEAINV